MRLVIALVAAVAIGVGVGRYLVPAGAGAVRARAPRAGPVQAGVGGDLNATVAGPSVAGRLEVLSKAANADLPTLQRTIERDASSSDEADQYAAGIFLARYAEIDPRGALRFALSHGLDETFLAPLFRALARTDSRAALEALGGLRDAHTAEAMGLAVLAALGYDSAAIERVAATLPVVDAARLRVDALAAAAKSDPKGAFVRALSWSDHVERRRALTRIGAIWVQHDPRAAFAEARAIPDLDTRNAVLGTLAAGWAAVDPEGLLDYLSSAGPGSLDTRLLASYAAPELRYADPARVLAMADRMPPETATMLRQIGIQALAQRDPQAALSYADNLPAGASRRQLLQTIAAAYGAKDPEAALAWVGGLSRPEQGLRAAVVRGIAREDFDRALTLAEELPPIERVQALQMIVMTDTAQGEDAPAKADRLLALPDGQEKSRVLGLFTRTWSERDAAAALEWVSANGVSLSAQVYSQIAGQVARQSPQLAADFTSQVPQAARAAWIGAVAQGYAVNDPNRALAWLQQFRGQPDYGPAVVSAAPTLSRSDPAAAARLLADVDGSDPRAQAVTRVVATQWAQQDPGAAAQWALDLGPEPVRRSVLGGIAQQWAQLDQTAAAGWALSLPPGADRDAALAPLVASAALAGAAEDPLMSAFSSDGARWDAVRRAIFNIALADQSKARAFVDRYVTDPAEHEQAERTLETAERNAGQVLINSGTGFFAPVGGRIP